MRSCSNAEARSAEMPLPLCAPRGVLVLGACPVLPAPLVGMPPGAHSGEVRLRAALPCGRLARCQGSRGSDRHLLAGQGPRALCAGMQPATGVLQVGGLPLSSLISQAGQARPCPAHKRWRHSAAFTSRGPPRLYTRGVFLLRGPLRHREASLPPRVRLRRRGSWHEGAQLGAQRGAPSPSSACFVPGSGTGTRRSALRGPFHHDAVALVVACR